MAIDQRAPKDNTTHLRSRACSWHYYASGHDQGIQTGLTHEFKSVRPTYPYGSVITLPGGTRFRKSTAYTHACREIGHVAGYSCVVGTHPNEKWSKDDTREIGSIIDQYANLRTGISSNMRNQVVTGALTKIADQKVNLGENLATMGQTIRLLKDASSTLLDALRSGYYNKSFRPFLLRSYRQLITDGISKRAAKHYLEYIYGLQPLVQDVFSLVDYAKKAGSKDLMLHSHSGCQSTTTIGMGSWHHNSNSAWRTLNGVAHEKANCHLHARINPDYQGLRALNQLGLLNPVGVAWDVIPWSFVVDWFIPVGPVLYAFTAPAGLTFIDGSIGWKCTEVSDCQYITDSLAVSGFSAFIKSESPCTVPITCENYSREHLTDWPLPGFWFDPDPFRGDRPLKALALAVAALSGARLNVR